MSVYLSVCKADSLFLIVGVLWAFKSFVYFERHKLSSEKIHCSPKSISHLELAFLFKVVETEKFRLRIKYLPNREKKTSLSGPTV